MTKKLKEMMTPKKTSAKKKRRRKRVPTKDQCLHRGVKFIVGDKRAMEFLYDAIKFQGHVPPAINMYMEDPCADFCINMYAEIASWDYKHLVTFIQEISGEQPKHKEQASLLGTVKSIFHALFTDNEETTQAALLRYDSKWKMWPGKIRLKPKGRKRKSRMATKKKASKKKQATKKKKVTRTAKKTARKKVGKKKTTKKAAASGRTNSIDVHLGKVEKMLKRRSGASVAEVVDSVEISKKSVRKLFGELGAERMEEAGRYSL